MESYQADHRRRETVDPLLRQVIELTIQLTHCHTLGIQHVDVNVLERVAFVTGGSQSGHGVGKHSEGTGESTTAT